MKGSHKNSRDLYLKVGQRMKLRRLESKVYLQNLKKLEKRKKNNEKIDLGEFCLKEGILKMQQTDHHLNSNCNLEVNELIFVEEFKEDKLEQYNFMEEGVSAFDYRWCCEELVSKYQQKYIFENPFYISQQLTFFQNILLQLTHEQYKSLRIFLIEQYCLYWWKVQGNFISFNFSEYEKLRNENDKNEVQIWNFWMDVKKKEKKKIEIPVIIEQQSKQSSLHQYQTFYKQNFRPNIETFRSNKRIKRKYYVNSMKQNNVQPIYSDSQASSIFTDNTCSDFIQDLEKPQEQEQRQEIPSSQSYFSDSESHSNKEFQKQKVVENQPQEQIGIFKRQFNKDEMIQQILSHVQKTKLIMKKNKKVMKEYPTHHAIVNYDRNTNKVLVGQKRTRFSRKHQINSNK